MTTTTVDWKRVFARTWDDERVVTRMWGNQVKGWHGREGGWIYDHRDRVVTQGWSGIWTRNIREILDWLTQRNTAFESFQDMTDNTLGSYRPTIFCTNASTRVLADCYDRYQEARGDPRRTFRGTLERNRP